MIIFVKNKKMNTQFQKGIQPNISRNRPRRQYYLNYGGSKSIVWSPSKVWSVFGRAKNHTIEGDFKFHKNYKEKHSLLSSISLPQQSEL